MTPTSRPTTSPRPPDGGDRDADPGGAVITCSFCGRAFEEDRGQPACRSCPLGEACRFVRCPHCGYENPARPAWLERLAALFGGDERKTGTNGGQSGAT